ncbi:MAG: hypothetical protein Q7R47_05955, partial [Candidatus Diapherotrites archaeon]|nr:hypothetical protein [Candidatus Diapherotrites archaeon]
WKDAESRGLRVQGKDLVQSTLRDERFPGTFFVRYRFDTLRRSDSPYLIVSFSGRDCIVHRVHKNNGTLYGSEGVRGLWETLRPVLFSDSRTRLWAYSPTKGGMDRIITQEMLSDEPDLRARRVIASTPQFRTERDRKVRLGVIWRKVLERDGFKPRAFGLPRAPKVIGQFHSDGQPLLWKKPKPRRGK